MQELNQDVRELRKKMEEYQTTLVRIAANQEFFRQIMTEHQENQAKLFNKICQRLEKTDQDVRNLENRLTYAAGAVAILVGGFSFIVQFIMKKFGS